MDRRWDFPTLNNLRQEIAAKQDEAQVHLPAYDFLVYLRHYGFPSPLLDWTESPYIAAYFAYLNASVANPAVYCYIELPRGMKMHSVGDSKIAVQGPYVSTDKRHFAQRAWYTIATKWDIGAETHVFCPHESVFSRNDKDQDVLIKIILPAAGRRDALLALADYNINHFTLFQSEDSLVKALETRIFDLRSI